MSCIRGPLTTNSVDYYVQHLVFPTQFLALTIIASTVLYNMATSRTKHMARYTLFILAIVEVLMFICMLPQSLGSFEVLYSDESFRRFYLLSKLPLYAISNLLAAIDTYVMVLITMEVYFRARRSSLAKVFFSGRNFVGLLAVTFLGAFLATAYHHFTYDQLVRFGCEETKMVTRVVLNQKYMTRDLYVILHSVSGVLVIAVPTMIVAFLNHKITKMIKSGKAQNDNECLELFSSDDTLSVQKKKVVVYLPAITVCFAITHVFSYLPFFWEMFLAPYIGTYLFSETISVVNSFLVSGKIANFALLYLSCIEMARNGLLEAY